MTFANYTYNPVIEQDRIELVAKIGGGEEWAVARPRAVSPQVLARIHRLEAETQVADWDDLGARPIPASVWTRTSELCAQIASVDQGLSDPFPSPCGDGSVHLRWTTPAHGELILEVRADQRIDHTYVSPNGEIEVGRWELGDDVANLVVQKLS